ncbi:hypothetical protein [Superficieibacter electus]|uniref:hypothetical protein n=1 Tax=Superficieibacter electus TaxID=2022662 RepID=UPI00159ED025|nr:hypothetical protein [Superficieibacter electus]
MAFWQQKTVVLPVKPTPAGLIFAVRHGKGLLQEKWGPGLCSLTWQDTPLINLWPDECPTCAGMVSAGFGADRKGAAQFLSAMAEWNQPFHDLPTSLSHLEPLLMLLPSGYYLLEDRELYPTDGNGHFFWDVSQQKSLNPATVSVMDREMQYSTPGPLYLLPTQSPAHYNAERAAYYRDKPDTRAIAWYFNDAYLCALLDGHHKASAAALEKRPLKSLVIAPVSRSTKESLTFYNGESLSATAFIKGIPKAIHYSRLNSEQYQACTSSVHNDTFSWPEEFAHCAAVFPDVATASTILEAGDISEKRIQRIIEGQTLLQDEDVPLILEALYYTHSTQFMPFARFVYQHDCGRTYCHLAFTLLAQQPCQQVDDFFVEFLIDDDAYRPDLTKIVDDYFRQR